MSSNGASSPAASQPAAAGGSGSSEVLPDDATFRFLCVLAPLVFMVVFLVKESKRAAKFRRLLARFQRAGTAVPESIRQDVSSVGGLGPGDIGFWVTAAVGGALFFLTLPV